MTSLVASISIISQSFCSHLRLLLYKTNGVLLADIYCCGCGCCCCLWSWRVLILLSNKRTAEWTEEQRGLWCHQKNELHHRVLPTASNFLLLPFKDLLSLSLSRRAWHIRELGVISLFDVVDDDDDDNDVVFLFFSFASYIPVAFLSSSIAIGSRIFEAYLSESLAFCRTATIQFVVRPSFHAAIDRTESTHTHTHTHTFNSQRGCVFVSQSVETRSCRL